MKQARQTTLLVDRDSATKRAWHWVVQCDVGQLSLVREGFITEKLSPCVYLLALCAIAFSLA